MDIVTLLSRNTLSDSKISRQATVSTKDSSLRAVNSFKKLRDFCQGPGKKLLGFVLAHMGTRYREQVTTDLSKNRAYTQSKDGHRLKRRGYTRGRRRFSPKRRQVRSLHDRLGRARMPLKKASYLRTPISSRYKLRSISPK